MTDHVIVSVDAPCFAALSPGKVPRSPKPPARVQRNARTAVAVLDPPATAPSSLMAFAELPSGVEEAIESLLPSARPGSFAAVQLESTLARLGPEGADDLAEAVHPTNDAASSLLQRRDVDDGVGIDGKGRLDHGEPAEKTEGTTDFVTGRAEHIAVTCPMSARGELPTALNADAIVGLDLLSSNARRD